MVNRSTFYDHFVDKYALMERTISELFREELAGKLPDAGQYGAQSLQVLIATMCEFFERLHGHCKPADQQNIALIESQVMKVVKEVLTAWLRDSTGAEPADAGAVELAVAIASWAIYGCAHHFTESKREGSIAQFAQQAVPIIEGTLKLKGAAGGGGLAGARWCQRLSRVPTYLSNSLAQHSQ